jgi:hypothetical protein
MTERFPRHGDLLTHVMMIETPSISQRRGCRTDAKASTDDARRRISSADKAPFAQRAPIRTSPSPVLWPRRSRMVARSSALLPCTGQPELRQILLDRVVPRRRPSSTSIPTSVAVNGFVADPMTMACAVSSRSAARRRRGRIRRPISPGPNGRSPARHRERAGQHGCDRSPQPGARAVLRARESGALRRARRRETRYRDYPQGKHRRRYTCGVMRRTSFQE